MKKLLEQLLAWHAKRILAKYEPTIIGITGSVGKTSTKEAVFAVLKGKFNVRQNIKNYNNELGTPLTIINANAGGKNPFAWAGVFLKAWGLILVRQSYPEVLVLEMGADHPGDIKYLTQLAPPHIGIVTAVGELTPVHMEYFSGPEAVAKEKAQMVRNVRKSGVSILNIDDKPVAAMEKVAKGTVVRVGFGAKASIRATNSKVFQEFKQDVDETNIGSTFKLEYEGNSVPIFLPHVLGEHQMYAALFAAAVGVAMEMNLIDIAEALKSYDSPPGRMHLIPGIKRTLLIDDTYNASPLAAHAAVKTLAEAKATGRKIVVMGTMAELGVATEKEHAGLGKFVHQQKIDYLLTTGTGGRLMANAAVKAGMNEDKVYEFEGAEDAGKFLQELMKEGDLVLIKGSQSSRMEKVTKEVMAEPMKAAEILVRQSADWLE